MWGHRATSAKVVRNDEVGRHAPCRLGRFSAASLIFARHAGQRIAQTHIAPWYAKKETTFSDALTQVRRLGWETVLKQSPKHGSLAKLPTALRRTLLDHLSHAA